MEGDKISDDQLNTLIKVSEADLNQDKISGADESNSLALLLALLELKQRRFVEKANF